MTTSETARLPEQFRAGKTGRAKAPRRRGGLASPPNTLNRRGGGGIVTNTDNGPGGGAAGRIDARAASK